MRALTFIAVALPLVLPAKAATAQQKTLREQLVGTWNLVSIANASNGKSVPSDFAGRKFASTYAPDGRVTWTVVQRAIGRGDAGSAGANKLVISGSYSINETDRSVLYHMDRASFLFGSTDPKTIVSINGDRLEQISQQTKEQPTTRTVRTQWQRVGQ